MVLKQRPFLSVGYLETNNRPMTSLSVFLLFSKHFYGATQRAWINLKVLSRAAYCLKDYRGGVIVSVFLIN